MITLQILQGYLPTYNILHDDYCPSPYSGAAPVLSGQPISFGCTLPCLSKNSREILLSLKTFTRTAGEGVALLESGRVEGQDVRDIITRDVISTNLINYIFFPSSLPPTSMSLSRKRFY